MKRYTLNENKGDIAYEVEDNLLTLKVRPEFVSSIPVGEGVYIIKTGDNTIPSDYNVLSAKRTMEEIEGAITGIKPAEQYWAIVKNAEDGTELEESEWFLAPKAGYSIYSPKNITAAGAIVAGYTSPNIEDPGVPIAGYEAIGYSKYDPEHFVVDETGLVHIKDGAGGGTGEFKDITLIPSTSTEKSSDSSVYTSLKVDYLLKNIDGKPSSLWVKDKKSEYLLLSDDGAKAKLLLPFDITGTLDVSGRIATQSDVAAEGAVWAGLKSTTVASNPVAGYDAIGMCRFDSTQFTVNQGLVRITGEIGGGTTSYWGVSGTGWAYAVLDDVSKQVSLYGHSHSTLSFNYGSLNSTTNTSYNGTSQTTVYIPTAVSHLTNDNGYIYDATVTTSPIKSLSNSGDATQYLNGEGSFATIPDTHLSHDVKYSIYVDTLNTQTITGEKWFSGTSKLITGVVNNAHIRYSEGSGNCINGYNKNKSTGEYEISNLYFNYNSDTSFIKCDPNDNFIASGSIIAGATSSAYSSNNFPTAGTSAKGMCSFDSTQFSVTPAGKVSILSNVISGGGGGGSTVSWKGTYTSTNGTSIGTLTIDGTSNTIYAPKVSISNTLTQDANSTRTKIGTITIGGSSTDIYCYQGINSFTTSNSDKALVTGVAYNFKTRALTITKGDIPTHSHSYLSSISAVQSGSGNVVTGISASGGTITYKMGTISGGGGDSYWSASGESIISYYWPDIVNSAPHIRFRSPNHTYNWSINNGKENLNIYCAKSSSSPLLYVNYGNGQWINNSDERLKNIHSDLKDSLSKIDRISTFYYTWNRDPNDHDMKIGVGALSVRSVYPELVTQSTNEDGSATGYYGVQYSLLSVIAIAGLKELHSLVKIQREEINSLRSWRLDKEEQISSLESRIAKLEQMLNELTVK